MINNEFLESLNILYVEDCISTQKSIKPFLDKFFKNVFFSLNGEDALKKYKKESLNGLQIDLLITDINMPKMNGLELITLAKELDESLKVVVTSSNVNEESFLEAIKLKVDYYAVKPINVGVLINEIQNIFLNKQNLLSSQGAYLNVMNKITLVSKMNTQGKITYINDCFTDIFKYDLEEIKNKDYSYIYDNSVSEKIKDELWEKITDGQVWQNIIKCKNKNGELCFINTYIFPIFEKINKKKIIDYTIIGFQVTQQEIKKREFRKDIFLKMKELNISIYDIKNKNSQLLEDILLQKAIVSRLEDKRNLLTQQVLTKDEEVLNRKSHIKKVVDSFKKKILSNKVKYKTQLKEKDKHILSLNDRIEQLEVGNKQLEKNLNESFFNLKRIFYNGDKKLNNNILHPNIVKKKCI